MEYDGQNQITRILKKMISLLEENPGISADYWASGMKYILEEYSQATDKRPAIVREIIKLLTGGMGSLGDVILYKDGEVLPKESEKLDMLRTELYHACVAFLGQNP